MIAVLSFQAANVIKIKDKLPSVEDLKKRLDMVEQELREYKENEEASAKDGNYTSNQETK